MIIDEWHSCEIVIQDAPESAAERLKRAERAVLDAVPDLDDSGASFAALRVELLAARVAFAAEQDDNRRAQECVRYDSPETQEAARIAWARSGTFRPS
jgi:hypothetical protein